jgi:hypothetical protein
MDPDPDLGGPKTYGSSRSGYATLVFRLDTLQILASSYLKQDGKQINTKYEGMNDRS